MKRKTKPVSPVATLPANPMRTVADLRRWMRVHVKGGDENGKPWTVKSLNAAVLWFHCVQEADCLSDMRTRDFASLLQTGMPPLTLADVQEALDELDDDERADLDGLLREHFGRFAT